MLHASRGRASSDTSTQRAIYIHEAGLSAARHITVLSDIHIDRQPFNGLFHRTTWVSRHQKGYTILDYNEARNDGVAVADIHTH